MGKTLLLSDHQHPLIQKKATELTTSHSGEEKILKALFTFVRDDIKFGFNRRWDSIPASQVLNEGIGYCNTKATLFVALLRAAGFKARIHCADIKMEIMHGIIPDIFHPVLPKFGSHSWTEILINGEWKKIDSYINDLHFFKGCREKQIQKNLHTGFSLASYKRAPDCSMHFGEFGFVHMDAVAQDKGTWNDLSDFIHSPFYRSLPSYMVITYPIVQKWLNKRIGDIRKLGYSLKQDSPPKFKSA